MVQKIPLMCGQPVVPEGPPVDKCCCEGGNMALQVTNDIDFSMLAKAAGNCGINVPPRIVGHRRRAVGVEGAVVIPGKTGAWLPITGLFSDIVADTPGTMCQAGQNYVVLPCAGHWRLWVMANLGGVITPGAIHGIAVTCNGAIYNRRFWPAPNGDLSQGECWFGYKFAAGDKIGVAVWSEDPVTLQSGSFHILAELVNP